MSAAHVDHRLLVEDVGVFNALTMEQAGDIRRRPRLDATRPAARLRVMDEINAAGMIPTSLIYWEVTGDDGMVRELAEGRPLPPR